MPMYNLLEHSLNYSDTTGSLRFYSKDKATDFNVDITHTNSFTSFKYKAKLVGNTETDGANRISRNAIIAVTLKHLNSF